MFIPVKTGDTVRVSHLEKKLCVFSRFFNRYDTIVTVIYFGNVLKIGYSHIFRYAYGNCETIGGQRR